MITLNVELGSRTYPIMIGSGLLDGAALIRQQITNSQVMIVSNETVAPLYLERIQSALSERRVATAILPDGEQHKTLASFEFVISTLLEQTFDRTCCVVALGGGVVGDIAGFVAAAYQRGVDFVQIPTTLLAQVDSSVGGKTAVNHPLGKNMIGAFHQPNCVIADIGTLSTLPERELKAGIAEVIKYGLINDADFFEWLERNIEQLLARDAEKLVYAIHTSCQSKANIVAQDELESGVRALLNLGHTFGHGIENVMGYGKWLHGEAVGCGLHLAADLSRRMGMMSVHDHNRVITLLQRAGLPISPPSQATPDALLEAMKVDKKSRDGRIRLILNRGIGKAFICDDYPSQLLDDVLAQRPA